MHLSIHPHPHPHTHTLYSRAVRTILQHINKALGQRPQVSDLGVVVFTHTVALHHQWTGGNSGLWKNPADANTIILGFIHSNRYYYVSGWGLALVGKPSILYIPLLGHTCSLWDWGHLIVKFIGPRVPPTAALNLFLHTASWAHILSSPCTDVFSYCCTILGMLEVWWPRSTLSFWFWFTNLILILICHSLLSHARTQSTTIEKLMDLIFLWVQWQMIEWTILPLVHTCGVGMVVTKGSNLVRE